MGRSLSVLGGVLTTTYFAGLWLLVGGRWNKLQEMPLNEIGDFLAGAFGPLAIVWLVLGYFQQGIELRQNSDALRLQADELANSVAQQKELVDVAKKQHETDRASLQHQLDLVAVEQERQRLAALPRFVIAPAGGSYGAVSNPIFSLTNLGAPCTEIWLQLQRSEQIGLDNPKFSMLKTDESVRFSLTYARDPLLVGDTLIVSYVDSTRMPGHEMYELSFARGDTYNRAVFTPVKYNFAA